MAGQNQFNLRPQAVSVSAMARMVGLSRASWYAYIKRGVFLAPIYSTGNKRPLYTADMIQQNLEARQTGIGCNGEYILFYEKHSHATPSPVRPARRNCHRELLDGLKSLGLDDVTPGQVEEALAVTFPNGPGTADESTVLRAIYRHLRRSGRG